MKLTQTRLLNSIVGSCPLSILVCLIVSFSQLGCNSVIYPNTVSENFRDGRIYRIRSFSVHAEIPSTISSPMSVQSRFANQMEINLNQEGLEQVLLQHYGGTFSQEDSAIPIDVKSVFDIDYQMNFIAFAWFIPSLFIIPADENASFGAKVSISCDEVELPVQRCSWVRKVWVSFFPTGLLPSFFNKGNGSFTIVPSMYAGNTLCDKDFDYVYQRIADMTVAAISSLPEENRKRFEILHKNKRLLME